MTIKLTMLISTFLILTINATGQNREIRNLIDTTIQIMKGNAVNSGNINWKKQRSKALKMVKTDTSASQIGRAIRGLYQALEDYHGVFYYKDSAFRWSHNEPVVSNSIMNEWKKGAGVRTSLLDGSIGYLRIPGMPYLNKRDCDVKAQNLNDSLCHLLNRNITGLIIDLRLNAGGAMYPMILGVQQLLQKGQIGSYQSKLKEKWHLTDTSFSIDTLVLASLKPKCNVSAQNIPVTILVSPPTGSSAEFFIIAFKSRPNTVLVGTSTAGFVTATQGFPIGDSAFVLLSTAYGKDRNGVVYKNAFEPDVPMNSDDNFNTL